MGCFYFAIHTISFPKLYLNGIPVLKCWLGLWAHVSEDCRFKPCSWDISSKAEYNLPNRYFNWKLTPLYDFFIASNGSPHSNCMAIRFLFMPVGLLHAFNTFKDPKFLTYHESVNVTVISKIESYEFKSHSADAVEGAVSHRWERSHAISKNRRVILWWGIFIPRSSSLQADFWLFFCFLYCSQEIDMCKLPALFPPTLIKAIVWL